MSTLGDEKTLTDISQLPKGDTESDERPNTQHTADTEKGVDLGGTYFVQEQTSNAHDGLKLAKDGFTVLIPQPSDDDEDPLNWSW
jgi:predicted RNA-binding protein with TRAM domain